MKQKNGQQSPEEELSIVNKKRSIKNEVEGDMHSNSFTDHFAETAVKKGKYSRMNAADTSLKHSQRDSQQSQKKSPSNKNPQQKENLKEGESAPAPSPSPGGTNGAISDRGQRLKSRWNMLDLKNKKQTGDLYKKILYLNKKNDAKAFCFTCTRGKEGVSTILANLVDYIRNQASNKKILLIDANTQSPHLGKIFNMSGLQYGLIDVLDKRIGLRDAIAAITSNIFLLNCSVNSNVSGNLEPEKLMALLKESRDLFDYILIDCPPVLSSADSLAIAPAADITFLVIQSIKVQKPVAQKTIKLLQDNECEIGGVVLNGVQQVIPNWVYKFI